MKEKTIRAKGQWVRITRDSSKRFSFAHGFEGDVKAFDLRTWPAEAFSTWADAVAYAEEKIENQP